jgi:hypothetical protein
MDLRSYESFMEEPSDARKTSSVNATCLLTPTHVGTRKTSFYGNIKSRRFPHVAYKHKRWILRLVDHVVLTCFTEKQPPYGRMMTSSE